MTTKTQQEFKWAWGNESGTDSAWRWFDIESAFYPELEGWFKSRFEAWLEEFHREDEDEHDED